MSCRVELLYVDGCPHRAALEPRLRALTAGRSGAVLELRRVSSEADARRTRFLGSPTVRVNGRDVEPGADARTDFGLKCRLYRVGTTLTGAPPDAWIDAALGVDLGPGSCRGATIAACGGQRGWVGR
jgi:hypothetical protein